MISLELKVFVPNQYFVDPSIEDLGGFEIIRLAPDSSGTVPVRRLIDNEYFCIPLLALSEFIDILPKITIKFNLDMRFSQAVIQDKRGGSIRGSAKLFSPSTAKPLVSWVNPNFNL